MVLACLKDWIKVQKFELLTDVFTIFVTFGWGKSEGMEFADSALANLSTYFRIPCESAGVVVTLLEEELKDMIGYGKMYLNIVVEECCTVWWKLFHAANAKN